MSLLPNASCNLVDADATSGSGEEMNMVDGHNKRQSTIPPSSSGQKRSRKATGDAIVDAMLEIASASKMRAAALIKTEDQFSITRCIKVLDDLQGMEDFDIELDEMELLATTLGYYYYNSITKQPQPSLSPNRPNYLTGLMEGPKDACREMLRMDKHVFLKLSGILRQRAMLRDTAGVSIEEQIAIFLNIIGHNERNRVIQDRFQHSGETISRHFNNVLKAIKSLSLEFMEQPPLITPIQILGSKRLFPYFKDCIGVIDSMHIPAHVPAKEQFRFRDKNGSLTQNVLAACTFDMQFIFIYPGWEGSASDSRVLQAVLDDPDQNFPQIPQDKYYLVDANYQNMEGFISPFPTVWYCMNEYKGANCMPKTLQELFNNRHSSLRQAILKSFHVLKERFPILKLAPQYAFHVQRDVVIAACVIHNFIRREDCNDWLFASVEDTIVDEVSDVSDLSEVQSGSPLKEEMGLLVRDSIATSMWNDFLNEWSEW